MFFDKAFNSFFTKLCRFKKNGPRISRFLAVIISIIVFLAAITALLWLIVPELYTSIMGIAATLPDQIDKIVLSVEDFFKRNDYLSALMTAFLDWEKEFIEKDLVALVAPYAGQVASGVIKTAEFLWDFIIGLIVASYMLLRKERFAAQAKKVLYAFVKKERCDKILIVLRKSNRIFSGFINGKIVDSIIMGILCFIGVWLLKMPYPVLVSVIVGFTNIIPVFGPYIGAIPCIILIGIVNPWKGLYFAIFILLLQQFDGNILGPKILGDSTGLSPFWVIFSIVVCGGLFGVPGMVIGVPLFAVIYYLINETVRFRLNEKNLPVETEVYINSKTVEYVKENTEEEAL
jgi:predicted PurR-regulated permease PerM